VARPLGVGYDYPGQVRPGPVEDGHITDPVHQRAGGAAGQFLEELIAGLPVAAGRFDLDELVIGERPVGLAGNGLGQPGIAQPHHRLQLVSEAAQMSALPIGQRFR